MAPSGTIFQCTPTSPPGDPDRAAAQAKELADEGFIALKTDPFMPEMRQHHRRYMKGEISPTGAVLGADTIAAMREAVGPDVEILVDAHGNFNVPDRHTDGP